MRPIFKDPILQDRYDKEGYVVVPFYTEEDIAELNNIHEALNSKLEDRGFYISIMSQNLAYKEKVHQLIKGIASKRAEKLFIDCNFISSSFAVKKTGKESVFDLHQGVNFTDESKYDTFTAWSPLIDVNEKNGCLFVLPGSHKLWHQIRKTPDFLPPIRNIKEHLWDKYAVEIKMKAGEALVFHHRLIHGSKPNFSNSVRLATLNAFIPQEAPLLLYTSKTLDVNDNELEIYQFHKDNYYTLDVLRKPDYMDGVEFIGNAKETVLTFTEQEYDDMYEKMMEGTLVI
ncbi:MAG TPA: phytanoyl-CoA dioxygenase family protein [Chitinophagales bacterium]|nr:phytanoyl-CoA dioxygenase family protein [Chitinophagales bacterium]